jgi:hypothetical protein
VNGKRLLPIGFLAIFIALISARPAYAYLDMGTGSYLFQIAAATFFGAAVALKVFWKRITTYFASLFNKEKPDQNDEK